MNNKNSDQQGKVGDGQRPPRRSVRHALFQSKAGRWSMAAFAVLSLVLVIAAGSYLSQLVAAAPDVTRLVDARLAQPSVVLAADGSELANFRRKQREWVALDQISPSVLQALLATEDRRFYQHHGVDVGRTLAAIFHTASGDTQGGSTITQQLARNLFRKEIGRSVSVSRKLKEAITAIQIERAYSKQQILETYLNTVPFLYNAFGIEMAARTYFNKSAEALEVVEAATLVGMLKGTYYYNPVLYPERALARRNLVLAQMVDQDKLPAAEYARLRELPLTLNFQRQVDSIRPSSHFAEHVRKWLTEWAEVQEIDLDTAGLTVHTTLDRELQDAAMLAVQRQADLLQAVADVEWGRRTAGLLAHDPKVYVRMRGKLEPFGYFWSTRPDLLEAFIRESPEFLEARRAARTDAAAFRSLAADPLFEKELRETKTRLESGFVAIEPASGEVKAWVGSRDFHRDQFDHVAQAERQPGSTFKPIVYGAALEQGFRPTQTYVDAPVEIRAPDGGVWRPTDMGAPTLRSMTLREGLIHSKNTITARVMQDVGLEDIVGLAKAAGINQSRLRAVPSLALGTSPVTLLEMVSAYATIARAGEYRAPVFVTRIDDRDGKVIEEFRSQSGQRAMSQETSIELIDMMRHVVKRGTGQGVINGFGVTADVAGKTGTTQYNTDGWFILMHPDLVAGSWVGFNDARVTMRSNHWGQGGHNALRVVGDFFQQALKEKLIDGNKKFARPPHQPLMAATPRRAPEATQASDEAPARIIVERQEDGTIFIGDDSGAADRRSGVRSTSKTPQEIARIMLSLGRDPVTGALLGSGDDSAGSSGEAEVVQGSGSVTAER